jgi:hypothetical protein
MTFIFRIIDDSWRYMAKVKLYIYRYLWMNTQRIITYHHTRNVPPIQMSIYNQMMIITICTKKVNTLSLAGTVHDQWEEVTGRHVDPLGHLILNLSQPICLLIVDFVYVSKENMIILFSRLGNKSKNVRRRDGNVKHCISENAIIVLDRKNTS